MNDNHGMSVWQGKGIYFADKASYSNNYAYNPRTSCPPERPDGKGDEKEMFLAKLLRGTETMMNRDEVKMGIPAFFTMMGGEAQMVPTDLVLPTCRVDAKLKSAKISSARLLILVSSHSSAVRYNPATARNSTRNRGSWQPRISSSTR